MNELIKINQTVINNEEVNAVNARDLHKALEVETRFADWIKRRLDACMAEENVDYTILKNKNALNTGFQTIEYIISIDTAKEISMLERNEKGKRIRKYFIECEKQLRNQQPILPRTYKEALIELVKAEEEKEKLMLVNKEQEQVIEDQSNRLNAYSAIQKSRRSSKEIMANITKYIRQYAYKYMNSNYRDAYNYFYNIYKHCHNLGYKTKVDSNYFKNNINASQELLEIILCELNHTEVI